VHLNLPSKQVCWKSDGAGRREQLTQFAGALHWRRTTCQIVASVFDIGISSVFYQCYMCPCCLLRLQAIVWGRMRLTNSGRRSWSC
jgi:hypothetical protein